MTERREEVQTALLGALVVKDTEKRKAVGKGLCEERDLCYPSPPPPRDSACLDVEGKEPVV
jgi:hypothetical protein